MPYSNKSSLALVRFVVLVCIFSLTYAVLFRTLSSDLESTLSFIRGNLFLQFARVSAVGLGLVYGATMLTYLKVSAPQSLRNLRTHLLG